LDEKWNGFKGEETDFFEIEIEKLRKRNDNQNIWIKSEDCSEPPDIDECSMEAQEEAKRIYSWLKHFLLSTENAETVMSETNENVQHFRKLYKESVKLKKKIRKKRSRCIEKKKAEPLATKTVLTTKEPKLPSTTFKELSQPTEINVTTETTLTTKTTETWETVDTVETIETSSQIPSTTTTVIIITFFAVVLVCLIIGLMLWKHPSLNAWAHLILIPLLSYRSCPQQETERHKNSLNDFDEESSL